MTSTVRRYGDFRQHLLRKRIVPCAYRNKTDRKCQHLRDEWHQRHRGGFRNSKPERYHEEQRSALRCNVQHHVNSTSGATLTIEPGVTVKFKDGTRMSISSTFEQFRGSKGQGTASAPIVFTSKKSRAHTRQMARDHLQQKFCRFIQRARLRDSGVWWRIAIWGRTATATYISSAFRPRSRILLFRNSSTAGIHAASSSAAFITRNTVMNNTTYGIYVSASQNLKMNSNDIVNNAQYGVYNASHHRNSMPRVTGGETRADPIMYSQSVRLRQ